MQRSLSKHPYMEALDTSLQHILHAPFKNSFQDSFLISRCDPLAGSWNGGYQNRSSRSRRQDKTSQEYNKKSIHHEDIKLRPWQKLQNLKLAKHPSQKNKEKDQLTSINLLYLRQRQAHLIPINSRPLQLQRISLKVNSLKILLIL